MPTTKSKRKSGQKSPHDKQKVKKTKREEDREEENEGEEPQLNEINSKHDFYASSIEMRQAYFENDAEFILLRDKLLGIAPGQVVVLYEGVQHCRLLLDKGALMTGAVENIEMEPGRCHSNVADLLDERPGSGIGIATGFCYSKDHSSEGGGRWRQHSWAISAEGSIIETCGTRDMYFGVMVEGFSRMMYRMNNATSPGYESSAECKEIVLEGLKKAGNAEKLVEDHDYRSTFIKKRDGN